MAAAVLLRGTTEMRLSALAALSSCGSAPSGELRGRGSEVGTSACEVSRSTPHERHMPRLAARTLESSCATARHMATPGAGSVPCARARRLPLGRLGEASGGLRASLPTGAKLFRGREHCERSRLHRVLLLRGALPKLRAGQRRERRVLLLLRGACIDARAHACVAGKSHQSSRHAWPRSQHARGVRVGASKHRDERGWRGLLHAFRPFHNLGNAIDGAGRWSRCWCSLASRRRRVLSRCPTARYTPAWRAWLLSASSEPARRRQ